MNLTYNQHCYDTINWTKTLQTTTPLEIIIFSLIALSFIWIISYITLQLMDAKK